MSTSDNGPCKIPAYFTAVKIPLKMNGLIKVSFHMLHQTFTDQRTWCLTWWMVQLKSSFIYHTKYLQTNTLEFEWCAFLNRPIMTVLSIYTLSCKLTLVVPQNVNNKRRILVLFAWNVIAEGKTTHFVHHMYLKRPILETCTSVANAICTTLLMSQDISENTLNRWVHCWHRESCWFSTISNTNRSSSA